MSETTEQLLVEHLRDSLRLSMEQHMMVVRELSAQMSVQHIFVELARRLLELDRNPYYNPTSFGSRERFEVWKTHERRDILEQMRKLDPSQFAVRLDLATCRRLRA